MKLNTIIRLEVDIKLHIPRGIYSSRKQVSLIKPASEYRIFGQTQIFVSNVRFGFVCHFNILIRFPKICSKVASRGSPYFLNHVYEKIA